MAAGEVQTTKIQTSLVSKWPEPIDINTDIFVPGKAEKWSRELIAALRTRELYQWVRMAPPSLRQLAEDNPDDDPALMIEVYDSLVRDRLYHLTTVADNLPSTVKYASLTLSERLRLNKLAADGLGAEMYGFITSLVDTRSGRAQDKLQEQFRECKVNPSDSVERVLSQIDLKWWLFKHNLLFCHTNSDCRCDAEGVRYILQMLMAGPPAFSLQASLELPTIQNSAIPDGSVWVQAKTEHIRRYGDQIAKQFAGGLHAMAPRAIDDYTPSNSLTNSGQDEQLAQLDVKYGQIMAMIDPETTIDADTWKKAGFKHDVNVVSQPCCNIKGCSGAPCIITTDENVTRGSKWDRIRVGWLVNFCRWYSTVKKPGFTDWKSIKDFTKIGYDARSCRPDRLDWKGKTPIGKQPGGFADSAGGKGGGRGGGKNGRGGRGAFNLMAPESSAVDSDTDDIDGMLAVLEEVSTSDMQEATAFRQCDSQATDGISFNLVMAGSLNMMHPGPQSAVQKKLSGSNSSSSSSEGGSAIVEHPFTDMMPAQQIVCSYKCCRQRNTAVPLSATASPADEQRRQEFAALQRASPRASPLKVDHGAGVGIDVGANVKPPPDTTIGTAGDTAAPPNRQLNFDPAADLLKGGQPPFKAAFVPPDQALAFEELCSNYELPQPSWDVGHRHIPEVVRSTTAPTSKQSTPSSPSMSPTSPSTASPEQPLSPPEPAMDIDVVWKQVAADYLAKMGEWQDEAFKAQDKLKEAMAEIDTQRARLHEADARAKDLLNQKLELEEVIEDSGLVPDSKLAKQQAARAELADVDELVAEPADGMVLPLVGLTREMNAKLPVISIGDGDHRVNKSTVSVMVRKLGGLAEAYDNAEGFPHQDCTRPEVGDPVLRKLRAGKARGLHVAIECSSFSPVAEQVRSMADFPSQVRGMPGLNSSQQRRVDVGNAFADFCVEALWSAFKGAVSWTAE